MKKALAAVLVLALVGLTAVAASAQVQNVQVYFNGNPAYNSFNGTSAQCQSFGTPQELYVVFLNWNMFIQGAEFSIDYPAALFIQGETAPMNTLVIGNSNADAMSTLGSGPGHGGIALAFNLPQNGFAPLLALTVHAIWTSNCDCSPSVNPQALVVRGQHYAEIGQGGQANPRAVRWPDYAEIDGVGMTSLICPGAVATEQTTWGGVKALYR